MVLDSWGDHGICKFWMLRPDRCFNGDKCRFRHPAEADRGRLWDEQLAAQAAEHSRIQVAQPPRLLPPRSHDRATGDGGGEEPDNSRTSLQPYHYSRATSNHGTSMHSPSRFHTDHTSREFWRRRTPEHSEKPLLETKCGKRTPSVYRTEHKRGGGYRPSMYEADDRDDFRPAAQYRLDIEYEPQMPGDQRFDRVFDEYSHEMAGWRESRAETACTMDDRYNGVFAQHPFQSDASSTVKGDYHPGEAFSTSEDLSERQQPKENANRLPLGRPNRLLERASSTAPSSISRDDTNLHDVPTLPKGILVDTCRDGVGGDRRDMSAAMEAPAAVLDDLGRGRRQHLINSKRFLGSNLTASTPSTMGATKRMSNGDAKIVGPFPSSIRVAAPYASEATLEKKLRPSSLDSHDKSLAEAREENIRLQGVAWLDTTRRALQLPVRTFTTACVYYHKFRLAHSDVDYNWADATAASLLTSCKVEDTLKKSKDILAAAYNAKASGLEQLGSDDPIFEAPSRVVIGLERLVLEAGGFDFRSRYPHKTLVKIARTLPASIESNTVAKVAYIILTDLHRTFAPLKQVSATLAFASLELAALLSAAGSPRDDSSIRNDIHAIDLAKWSTTREEVMETLLDALDLYTHHTTATILGTQYSLEYFLQIRLSLNKECTESNLPRHTTAPEPSLDRTSSNGATLRVTDGHPTPVSPPQPDSQAPSVTVSNLQSAPETSGTLRFMLSPQLSADEQAEVRRYFVEEWEEYDEEIEIPISRPRQTSRERERERPRDLMDRRPVDLMDDRRAGPMPPARDDRHRDRAIDRDRMRYERRYDDRERRFDERRERRYDDRRYERRDDRR